MNLTEVVDRLWRDGKALWKVTRRLKGSNEHMLNNRRPITRCIVRCQWPLNSWMAATASDILVNWFIYRGGDRDKEREDQHGMGYSVVFHPDGGSLYTERHLK